MAAPAGRSRWRALLAVIAAVVVVGGVVLAATSEGVLAITAGVIVAIVLLYEAVYLLRVASGRAERARPHRAR